MRPGTRWLVCVTLTLWASPASAQPLFQFERDWTAYLGGELYGFRDVIQTPGGFRRTQVWIGSRLFHPADVAADRWLLVIPPVAAALAVRYVTRPLRPGHRP